MNREHTTQVRGTGMFAKHFHGLLVIALLHTAATTNAQTVIGSAGGSSVAGGNGISWTIGEPVTRTAQGGDAILTQGFQQPWADVSTAIAEEAFNPADWRVYPNPADHILYVETTAADVHRLLDLLDAAGRSTLRVHMPGNRTELDLSGLSAGSYFLRISGEQEQDTHTYQITINH